MLRRLLVAMLVRVNRAVTIETLIDDLWDVAPAGARKTTQIYVHRLRDLLGEQACILQEPGGYRLKAAPGEFDADQFDDLARQGRTMLAQGNNVPAARVLGQALALWRGSAYEDFADRASVVDEAQRLEEQRLQVTSDYLKARLALGHHEDLIPQLFGLVDRNPYREDLRGHLMLALYRAGRQTEALDVYRKARQILADELGIEPGPALQRLHGSILRSDPELELTQPEKSPPAIIPRELPAATAGFTGREPQLATLDRVLLADAPATVPIALISGSGGVGKTALALRWAHLRANRFPDGQLFIDLRGYSTGTRMRPIEALTGLLRSVGVPPRRIPIDVAEAAALYRSHLANRRMLVVLDNARSADEVRMLLPGTSSCAAIVTSRDRLTGLVARNGAVRIPLEVLSPDEATTLITDLLDNAQHERDAVHALAAACANLPLALRIAVAHLLDHPHQSIGDLVTQLHTGHRLQQLEVIGDDTAAVQSTFALSYQAVSPDAQLVFRRLGLVSLHDFTPQSAAALADVPENRAAALLERLADAHLITATSKDCYSIHDLLRDYAAERCTAEDSASALGTAINRLYDVYLSVTAAAAQQLYPSKLRAPSPAPHKIGALSESTSALAWLDAEYANIVVVVRHSASTGASAWQLADQLRGFFDQRRHMVEWFAASRAGLWAARLNDDAQGQAAMFHMLGHAYGAMNQDGPARANFTRALALYRACGVQEGEAMTLGNLGILDAYVGRPQLAKERFIESLETRRRSGQEHRNGATLQNLATCYWQMGELSTSVQICDRAIELMRETGASRHRVNSTLSRVLCLQGLHTRGIPGLVDVLRISRSIGDMPFEAYTHAYMSEALLELARDVEARDSATASVRISRDIDVSAGLVAGLTVLGQYLHHVGDDSGACQVLHEAVDVAERARLSFRLAGASIALSRSQSEADPESALASAQKALDLSSQSGFRLLQGQALAVMARILHEQGDRTQAAERAAESLAIQRQTGHRLGEAEALAVLAQSGPNPELAIKYRQAARDIYQETGAVPPRGLTMSGG